ncbi:hypothetical protein SBV1_1910007 [Verrucomicrobia bacterium]|nr:hypothetical protein SBV1_1910007 [Verrucomicrobiota bacterium]
MVKLRRIHGNGYVYGPDHLSPAPEDRGFFERKGSAQRNEGSSLEALLCFCRVNLIRWKGES